jgi:hypothetical protein
MEMSGRLGSLDRTWWSTQEASMKTDLQKVRRLAIDLRTGYPRSPREKLGGYVIAARCADKCRAFLLDMNGEYNYWPCSLASQWFGFTGITPDQFKDMVATGATDEELARWIGEHSKIADFDEVLKWISKSIFLNSFRTIVRCTSGSTCMTWKKSGFDCT